NVIYDLYVPFVTEGLAQRGHWQEDSRAASRNYRTAKAAYEIALLCGNRFICASERQRDLWLGVLSELGRVDADAFRADPSLRQLIDVVPFGLSSGAPGGSSSVLKGVVPGISATDRVLLWGGGVWNWLDPLTVIRAVHRISQARNDVKLYFLGLRHPNPEQPETAMAARAVALARELGVENRFVFFNFGWTPYEERERYLVEADLGVSGHFDTVETRFAFRTRLLDYFWAGLPVVTTRGDELGDVVEREGLGRAIEAEDVAGWVEAILELLDDGVAYDRCRAALDAVRRWYEWQTVARPLSRLCAIPGEPVPSGARSWRLSAEHAALTLRGSLADRGVRETLQEMSARITGGG
ncbi:MAG: glycosyltransferase family 4 protein, partial [Dehalococcoidia bacterium]